MSNRQGKNHQSGKGKVSLLEKPMLCEARAFRAQGTSWTFSQAGEVALLMVGERSWGLSLTSLFLYQPPGGILRKSTMKGGEEGWFLVTEGTPVLWRA